MENMIYIPKRRRRRSRFLSILPALLLSCMLFFGMGKLFGVVIYGLGADYNAPNGNYAADSIHINSQSEEPDDWALILVNPWKELPKDYFVERTTLRGNHSIDSRAYPDLQKMMDDARAQGLSPVICSSYRTMDKQTELFQNQVAKFLKSGYSQTEAEKEAAKWVAIPGTSEHQTGLALDIVSTDNQRLEKEQEDTQLQKWLLKNSWKYGFILRYPEDKTDLTGIQYEPWHYRYVGKEAAKEMNERGICLEEYLQ